MHGRKEVEVMFKLFNNHYDTSTINKNRTATNNQYCPPSMADYWIWARINENTNIKMKIICKYFLIYRIESFTLFKNFVYILVNLKKNIYGVMLPTSYYFMKKNLSEYISLMT